jgi:NAD(P)-dependent dehydrogenase (short-subunit alcohol dehydrogenase family)
VYAGVRKDKDAESIKDEALVNLVPILLDVTNIKHIEDAVNTIEVSKRPLIALVNNAGIAMSDSPIELVDLKRWRYLFDVNVFGLLSVTQHFLPHLRSSHGRIINIGSIAGDISQPLWSPYSSSKHALEAISDSLRVELRPFHISVSLIKPGEIQTNIYKKMEADSNFDNNNNNNNWSLKKDYEATLKKCRSATTDETKSLYSGAVKSSLEFVHHCATTTDRGEIPTVVMTNNAITHAIMSRTPRTRYVFGGGSAAWITNLILPDKISDALMSWLFNFAGWKMLQDGIGLPLFKFLNAIFYW